MRRRITWRSAAAISMLGLAPGIGAAFAGPAGASTKACADALGTQCGTFTESAYNGPAPGGGNNGGLGWDVKGQSTASNTPLIEYKNYSPGRDPGTDLTKVEHYGAIPGAPSRAPGIWYSIVFTPSGKWTSMCLSNPDNPGRDGTNLVLRSCNQQKWQAFLALPIPIPAETMSCRRRPRPCGASRYPSTARTPPPTSTPCTAWRTASLSRAKASRARLFPLPANTETPPPPVTLTRGTGRMPPASELAVNSRRVEDGAAPG